jgi:DNA invertase Pin-like site-specific DNA recombinase
MISPDGALHIRHSPVFEPLIAADNPHANRFTVHILAAVAEHERAAISERTKAALAAVSSKSSWSSGKM